jgi:regulator of replication initiation timing
MFVGARQLGASQLEAEDMGQYQELIELQKQIVKVAEQNAVTQQRCARLREQLDREVNALIGPRRPVHERLRDAAAGMLDRLRRRPDAIPDVRRP